MRVELLERIQRAKNLFKINLASLGLADDEVEEAMSHILQVNPHLTQFNLDDNQLSDRGAQLLSTSLRTFNKLTELSLQFNRIGRDGALVLFALKKEYPDLDIAFHGNKIIDVGEMLAIEADALK